MTKGAKIIVSVLAISGVGVLVWLMFFKKESPLYVLKSRQDQDDTDTNGGGSGGGSGGESVGDTTGGGSGGGTTGGGTSTATCPYPNTPFENRSQGNDFRKWVNDNYSSVAKEIDLDRTGDYNNCYIRKAYAYKSTGGRTLGNLYQGTINSETTPPATTDAWDRFVQRVKDQGLYSKSVTNGTCIQMRLYSDDYSSMKSTTYQIAYCNNGTWALVYRKNNSGDWIKLAQGTFNMSDIKAGTKIKVTKTYESSPLEVGYGVTANNEILYPIQMVIYKFWSGWGMTKPMAQTIEDIEY